MDRGDVADRAAGIVVVGAGIGGLGAALALSRLGKRVTLVERLSDFVAATHPYDVPAIVVHPIVGGSKTYLQWISAETTQGS